VNHSTLSQMLRGRRRITADAIESSGLAWVSPGRYRRWIGVTAPAAKEIARQLHQLAQDAAEVLEDWRNFAILELTGLTIQTAHGGSRMLGIAVDEVNIAISRFAAGWATMWVADLQHGDGSGKFQRGGCGADVQQMHELTAAGCAMRRGSERA
jgi:hypothetical protein